MQGKALWQMVGTQRIEGPIPSRRKLQEPAAQRVRYPHIPAASQHRISYSMEEIPEMGTCIVMEWIDGYHAGTLER